MSDPRNPDDENKGKKPASQSSQQEQNQESIEKAKNRLNKSIDEFYTTENIFIKQMKIFVANLFDQDQIGNYSTLKENHKLFTNKSDYLSNSVRTEFANLLKPYVEIANMGNRFGPCPPSNLEAITKIHDTMKKMGDYYESLSNATLSYTPLQNEKFNAKKIELTSQGEILRLDFYAFAIQPIQRLPRYDILLKEILSHAEKSNNSEIAEKTGQALRHNKAIVHRLDRLPEIQGAIEKKLKIIFENHNPASLKEKILLEKTKKELESLYKEYAKIADPFPATVNSNSRTKPSHRIPDIAGEAAPAAGRRQHSSASDKPSNSSSSVATAMPARPKANSAPSTREKAYPQHHSKHERKHIVSDSGAHTRERRSSSVSDSQQKQREFKERYIRGAEKTIGSTIQKDKKQGSRISHQHTTSKPTQSIAEQRKRYSQLAKTSDRSDRRDRRDSASSTLNNPDKDNPPRKKP